MYQNEYEQLRLDNIARNNAKLEELGLLGVGSFQIPNTHQVKVNEFRKHRSRKDESDDSDSDYAENEDEEEDEEEEE